MKSGEQITVELLSDPQRAARLRRGLAELGRPALPDLSALAARYVEAAQRAKAANQAEAFLDLVTASRGCFALARQIARAERRLAEMERADTLTGG